MYYLNALGLITALGQTHAATRQSLALATSGLRYSDRYSPGHSLPLGGVDVVNAKEDLPLADRSRNNRLALAALAQIRTEVGGAIDRYGHSRIGIVLGTSTSGISETEHALPHYQAHGVWPTVFHYGQQELGSLAAALAYTLKLTGPAYVHSSACASSAKAMMSAARLIQLGLCDAVITGGVDSLGKMTVMGFSALASVSAVQCNPFSVNRAGINIGEGAALFLMTKEPALVTLRGWGESVDAYHMSAPDPSGRGARLAIQQALTRAGIMASQVDYVNLHGTATMQNDAMESAVMADLLGDSIYMSSTKPLTGHVLGATSAIEAGLCWLAMQDEQGVLPPHLWDGQQDPLLPPLNLVKPGTRLGHPLRYALTNSFAFGGSNASLLLARA